MRRPAPCMPRTMKADMIICTDPRRNQAIERLGTPCSTLTLAGLTFAWCSMFRTQRQLSTSAQPQRSFGLCGSNWRHFPRRARFAVKALHENDLPLRHRYVNEVITVFTSEGVVRFPDRRVAAPQEVPALRGLDRPLPTWEEQLLCIGSTFQVAATNGKDPARRVNIQGFCQSVDVLTETVLDAVVSRGGEVLDQQRLLKSGVSEDLKLTVFIPYLWGVPPELDTLSEAIEHGGGFVQRVYQQWGMYRRVDFEA